MLANESSLEKDDAGEYRPVGDPTEVSLFVSAMKGGLEEGKELIDYVWLDEIPFESDRMFMATLHRDTADGGSHCLHQGRARPDCRHVQPGADARRERGTLRCRTGEAG